MTNPFKKLLDILRGRRDRRLSRFREMNGYSANFSAFGDDMNKSDLVRSCVRALADQTSKAMAVVKNDPVLERMLRYRPNPYMNGKDFLYKVRANYELRNTAFILIMRDSAGKITAFYPFSYMDFEAYEDENGWIFVKFYTSKGDYWVSWDDLVVLRKDYNLHDIAGDDNSPIFNTLNLIQTSNESIENAVKSTANLRGIIKTSKGMLKPEDLKAARDQFVEDYMDPSTGNGIGALDASQDFIETHVTPEITDWQTMKEFRENVFRYFGVNDDILMAKATPEQMQEFYELKIEPFLMALSLEMTSKVYTDKQLAFGNEITFDTSTTQFMTMSDKMALFNGPVLYGAVSINTWCDIMNLPHVEGGDVPIRRLDAAPVDVPAADDTQEGADDGQQE